MSKLAKASGVPQSTIYVYFESKEDLLRQIYLYCIDKMNTTVMNGFDDTKSVKDCLWDYCLRFVECLHS